VVAKAEKGVMALSLPRLPFRGETTQTSALNR
jgi:hypothetical protein